MASNKQKALQDGIKQALADFNSYSFKIDAYDIVLTGISAISISDELKYFPSDKVDESNLEKCTGGTFNATFQITYQSDEIEISCPCTVSNCTFSVEN